VDIDALQEMLPEATSTGLIATAAIVLALCLFLLLRLLGVSWYVLRFYDYHLTRTGNDLRISCGLFTKVSATIPRERVQVISVHRGFLMRWLKLAAIRIETAGGAGSENENAASTVSRRWFLPVIRESELAAVLEALRPSIAQDLPQLAKTSKSDPPSSSSASHSDLDWHSVSPLTERRLMRLTLIAVLLVSVMGWLFWKPWGLLAGPAIAPWLILLARKKSRSKKFARAEWGVAYQSGWLTQKMSLAFYDRIQALSVAQSPFDRRWKMASLVVDTAAAGPAEHAIDISYLDEQFAFMQFEELQQKIAYHQPRWA
jgi:putative membrane protein